MDKDKFQCEKCGKEYALQEAVVCCDNCFPKWQPIVNIPNGEQELLLWDSRYGKPTIMIIFGSEGLRTSKRYTHWMPLPQQPEE